jgi:hypothetical protein
MFEEKKKTIIVSAKDYYGDVCLADSLGGRSKNIHKRRPQGKVEIHEINEKGEDKVIYKNNNLVVYLARELICEKIFNIENASTSPEISEFLCWAGIGNGSVNPADPFDPYPPINQDVSLGNDVPINPTNAAYADFHDGYYHKVPFTLEYEQDGYNDNAWLIAKIGITFGVADAVDQEVNEVGLFTAASDAGGYVGPFHLFSKLTFPTIIKSATIQLVFVWYLYF